MFKYLLTIFFTILLFFIIFIPFLSTPVGENAYHEYQESKLHKLIYCQYIEWFGAKGFSQLKYLYRCKLPTFN